MSSLLKRSRKREVLNIRAEVFNYRCLWIAEYKSALGGGGVDGKNFHSFHSSLP